MNFQQFTKELVPNLQQQPWIVYQQNASNNFANNLNNQQKLLKEQKFQNHQGEYKEIEDDLTTTIKIDQKSNFKSKKFLKRKTRRDLVKDQCEGRKREVPQIIRPSPQFRKLNSNLDGSVQHSTNNNFDDLSQEETHKKLEQMSGEMARIEFKNQQINEQQGDSNRKRVRKHKRKNQTKNLANQSQILAQAQQGLLIQDEIVSENSSSGDPSSPSASSANSSIKQMLEDFSVCLKYNELTSKQLVVKQGVLQIQERISAANYNDESNKDSALKGCPYPFTGMLTKHVQSLNGRPIFYFEVKLVGSIDSDKFDSKAGQFCVGFSTEDFSGTKAVGDNKESIGLCGDGKIHFYDNNMTKQQQDVNNREEIKFLQGLTFGVGYIFRTKKVIFTLNGKELRCVDLPKQLHNKILYPAVSLASRENHKVQINLGLKRFDFDLDDYVQNKYYKQLYSDISTFGKVQNQEKQIQKEQKLTQIRQFHEVIKDYLITEGFDETLKEVYHNNGQFLNNYCNMKQKDSSNIRDNFIDHKQSGQGMELPNLVTSPWKDKFNSQMFEQSNSHSGIKENSKSKPISQLSITDIPQNKLIQSPNMKDSILNTQDDKLFQIELRKKVRHFIITNKIKDASRLLKENFPELWASNKVLECSLLSIEFVNCFKDQNIEGAIKLLQQYPLNKSQMCNSFQHIQKNEEVEIVSVDTEGAQVMIRPEELTRLFCYRMPTKYSQKKTKDPLLTGKHTQMVASYINYEILNHLKSMTNSASFRVTYENYSNSKIDKLLRQCCLNVNYGLNNFYKHKLFGINPDALRKSKYENVKKCHYPQSIGIGVPHFNPMEKIREGERAKALKEKEENYENQSNDLF